MLRNSIFNKYNKHNAKALPKLKQVAR